MKVKPGSWLDLTQSLQSQNANPGIQVVEAVLKGSKKCIGFEFPYSCLTKQVPLVSNLLTPKKTQQIVSLINGKNMPPA